MARMPKGFSIAVVGALMALAWCAPARAQDDTRDDFWPEVDGFVGMGDRARLMFMASTDRSKETDYREGTVGVHVDYFALHLFRKWLREHPDDAKKNFLTFRAGYRYSWDMSDSPGGYTENRLLVEGTGRVALGRLFLMNRSRFEWRDVNDTWSWRYRNRTRLEGDIPMRSRTATPYIMAEFFYDSRYDEWNRQLYYVGVDWPVHRKAVLETYYARQDDSIAKVAHENIAGLTLKLFF